MDSDAELKGAAGRWESVLERLNTWEAQNDGLPLLVAIGAGTQDIDRNDPQRPLWNWLSGRREKVLAIMCSPEETWDRRAQFHDTLASVLATEFDASRVRLYEIARESIVTSALTELEAAEELNRALQVEAGSHLIDTSDGHEPLTV